MVPWPVLISLFQFDEVSILHDGVEVGWLHCVIWRRFEATEIIARVLDQWLNAARRDAASEGLFRVFD